MNPLIIIDGLDCTDKESLFGTFSDELQFPDYFGSNWDSFEEVINDLPFSEDYRILIIHHDEILKDHPADKETFNTILKEANKNCSYQFYKDKKF